MIFALYSSFTSTYEQIAEWIEEPFDVEGYPLWIKGHPTIHKHILCKSRGKKKKRKKVKRKEGAVSDLSSRANLFE
jgi:hypothetical protein